MCRPKEQHARRSLVDDLAGGGVTNCHADQSDWRRQGIAHSKIVCFLILKINKVGIEDVTMNDVSVNSRTKWIELQRVLLDSCFVLFFFINLNQTDETSLVYYAVICSLNFYTHYHLVRLRVNACMNYILFLMVLLNNYDQNIN